MCLFLAGYILLTKSLSCNLSILSGMPCIPESSKVFKKSYFKCLRKILCKFQLREVRSHVFIRTAQSCVRMPISVEKLQIVQGLHPSRHHGNTSECQSEFVKYLDFRCRHVYGKTTASIRMSGQHRPNEVLNKAIHEEEL
jgi:hypothetical protein